MTRIRLVARVDRDKDGPTLGENESLQTSSNKKCLQTLNTRVSECFWQQYVSKTIVKLMGLSDFHSNSGQVSC